MQIGNRTSFKHQNSHEKSITKVCLETHHTTSFPFPFRFPFINVTKFCNFSSLLNPKNSKNPDKLQKQHFIFKNQHKHFDHSKLEHFHLQTPLNQKTKNKFITSSNWSTFCLGLFMHAPINRWLVFALLVTPDSGNFVNNDGT